MPGPTAALRLGDLTLSPAGEGYLARLDGLYPVLARLLPGEGGWSVVLVGVSFNAGPEPVAAGLASLEEAAGAAGAALRAVVALERRDDYRFRPQPDGPNRWYRDRTARLPAAWDGRLPDLAGERLPAGAAEAVLGYLDAAFPHLVNLAQHRPHFDPARGRTTDPNEHTVEVLAALDTAELTAREALLARLAVLYHDVGKGLDAYDPRHPLESARLAAPLLAQHGLTAEEQAAVLLHIREHDLLGVLSRGRMTVEEALARLELRRRPSNLPLHAAIAGADISAIRGLRWVVAEGRIARARRALEAALDAGSS